MKNTKRLLARGVIGPLIVASLLLLPAAPALGKVHFPAGPTNQVPLGPYRVIADPYPVDLYLYYPPARSIHGGNLALRGSGPSGNWPSGS